MSDSNTLAVELIRCTNPSTEIEIERERIPISQMQHRLNLLSAWFGGLDAARTSLTDKTILEIGCGQGDMTVALAWAIGPSGTVHAIDPAPLDYGSPESLGEAQSRISQSAIGATINWRQCDPVEAVQTGLTLHAADYIVLAHSLLYMHSTEYIAALLKALSHATSTAAGSASPKLLIAEWGMQVSVDSARAHLYAVQAQAAQPLHEGNVRMYIEPKVTMELALGASWKEEKQVWIMSPDLDDGAWEVAAARSIPATDGTNNATRDYLTEMESASSEHFRCMDVWTGVFG